MEKPDNRHLETVLTFVGLVPLVYYIPHWISQFISPDRGINTLLSLAVIVPLISYLWLPLTMKWLAKWRQGRFW